MEAVREVVRGRIRFQVALESEIDAALADAYGEPLTAPAT
jgi:hypothetical protein